MQRLFAFLLLLVVLLLASSRWILDIADGALNRVTQSPAAVPPDVQAFHDSLWIADFHNDALLWNRDLRDGSARGALDIPRMRAGGFELAVFSATTRHYVASNYTRTPPVGDVMALAAFAQRWPRASWLDPFPRALVLARELRRTAQSSSGRLRMVETHDDLETLLRDQAHGDDVIGAVLLLEGLHAADGRIARIDSLFAAGYRVFGLTHMFDNDVAGASSGWRKRGLTPFGRRAVARIDSLGGIIDLAHASRATIDEVLALTTRPVVVSHTGITSACAGPRNIPDDVVAAIGERGGIVAIGFWKAAVCAGDARGIARSIHRAIAVAGVDHVALGSDFDGATAVPFDAAHMATLTAALLDEGLTRNQVRAVMGENEKRFLLEILPRER
ncbi:MAG TPA: membrane dipeptidase [Candidatus Krumholzibacteria bacterium]